MWNINTTSRQYTSALPGTSLTKHVVAILVLLGIFAACQAVDVCTTVYALNHGSQELNPVMTGVVENPLLFWGVKGAVVCLFALVGWHALHAGRPRLGVGGLTIVTCIAFIPVLLNLITLVNAGAMPDFLAGGWRDAFRG